MENEIQNELIKLEKLKEAKLNYIDQIVKLKEKKLKEVGLINDNDKVNDNGDDEQDKDETENNYGDDQQDKDVLNEDEKENDDNDKQISN